MPNEYSDSEFNKLREKLHALEVDVAVLKQAKFDSDKALGIADQALKHNQDANNEWRQENIDQRNLFPNKDEVNGRLTTEAAKREALENRVYTLEKVLSADSGKHSAFDAIWLKFTVVATLLMTAISLAYRFLTGK